jgi:NADPH:quinone reductase-like Zn-dependent oxidoreductase
MPGPGQVRVAVKRLGLNPVDSALRAGYLQEYMPIELPHGIGNEFAGAIDEVGDGVSEVALSDEVFGPAPFSAEAEYLVVEAATSPESRPQSPGRLPPLFRSQE